MKLTVVAGSSGRMVRSMMDETAGDLIMGWCREHGVSVLTGQRVAAIEAGPTVLLADGQALKADLVVVASGVRPNSEFAAAAGIVVKEGIVVDGYLKTSLDGIFAAGDVAQGPDFSTRTRSVHAIQPTATEHGRVAAMNMGAPHCLARQPRITCSTRGLISSRSASGRGCAASAIHLDAQRFATSPKLTATADRRQSVGRTETWALRGLSRSGTPGAWKDRLMPPLPFRRPCRRDA